MYESLFEQINRPDSRCIAPPPLPPHTNNKVAAENSLFYSKNVPLLIKFFILMYNQQPRRERRGIKPSARITEKELYR